MLNEFEPKCCQQALDVTGADLRLNSSSHNAWRNGTARSGFSFCFSRKYPNSSNAGSSEENQHGGRDKFLCGGQTQAVPLETGIWPRVPARVRVPTSSNKGTAAEGLSSNFFVHLRTLPHSSRWARELGDFFIG